MVAAGLGFAFMPVHAVKHPDVVGVPVVEPEFLAPGETWSRCAGPPAFDRRRRAGAPRRCAKGLVRPKGDQLGGRPKRDQAETRASA